MKLPRYILWRWDKHQTSADEVMLFPEGTVLNDIINTEENVVDLVSGRMWTGREIDHNGKISAVFCGHVDIKRLKEVDTDDRY